MMAEVKKSIVEHKIISIVRGMAPDVCAHLADAYLEGGVHLMEITFNQAKPETWADTQKAIRHLCDHYEGQILAGAGTVLTVDQYKMAIDAGAKYIITPVVNVPVIRAAKEDGVVCMPGALTPTDVLDAWEAGATFVKLFPAGTFGVKYFKDVKAPLSHIPLLAVGGISAANIREFLDAGAVGFGISSALVDKRAIAAGDWKTIAAAAKELVDAIS